VNIAMAYFTRGSRALKMRRMPAKRAPNRR
jgi:hypothetical protein